MLNPSIYVFDENNGQAKLHQINENEKVNVLNRKYFKILYT
jgi:hypothetical protein